jgi:hypothetical protein
MVRCDWCGGEPHEGSADTWSHYRLVQHRGKKELWCIACVEEDAYGNVSDLHAIDGRKRKKDRPKTFDD